MYSANTILRCLLAPKDAYSFEYFKNWYTKTKRKWKSGDVFGADEAKVLENNRRHKIQYNRTLDVLGWKSIRAVKSTSKKTKKTEQFYQDVVGDMYYNYYHKFNSYVLDWWGTGGSGGAHKIKAKRNGKSVPNTPMLNVSFHMNANSLMEKLYINGMSYEEAVSTTFRGRQVSIVLIKDLTRFNISQGMDDVSAYHEALRLVEIYMRNMALTNNALTDNEYNFVLNYYNKHIDKKIREMLPIQLNFWFLKELLTYHPNIGVYVLGPYNLLYRVQGLVSRRSKNILIRLETFKPNSSRYKIQFVYSVSKDTLVNEINKGYIPASKLKREGSNIHNMMYGRKKIIVDHRYRTDTFYDLILEGHMINGRIPWIDAHHTCWVAPNYSNPKNLKGLDIIC